MTLSWAEGLRLEARLMRSASWDCAGAPGDCGPDQNCAGVTPASRAAFFPRAGSARPSWDRITGRVHHADHGRQRARLLTALLEPPHGQLCHELAAGRMWSGELLGVHRFRHADSRSVLTVTLCSD